MENLKIAIIGRGRVGGTLARVLTEKGHAPSDAVKEADVVILAVPDDVIENVCGELSERNGLKDGACMLHCSGVKSAESLAEARDVGVSVASMHPLQSFAGDETGNPFDGIIVSIEGDEKATKTAFEVAKTLGAQPVEIDGKAKMLYHASAVVASNYLVTILDLALNLVEKAGLDREVAMKGFMPLIQGTLKNVQEKGPVEALTGPLARGDVGTIARHVSEMNEKTPEFAALYTALGQATLSLVEEKGVLDIEAIERLNDALKGEE